MTRRRDARSPSPAGSLHGQSRRNRRGDGRSTRGYVDDRSNRRRSRSRSHERNYGGREPPRRRDRSLERRGDQRTEEGHRRPSTRRDHSEERKRSRDRSPRRDRGYIDGDKRLRDGHHQGYDRGRDRQGESTDRRRSQADTHEDRPRESLTSRKSGETVLNKQTDEERKKHERLAKLEAWKTKQATEREKKQRELEALGGARNILQQMDDKAANVAGGVGQPSPQEQQVETLFEPQGKRFDPKTIVRKPREHTNKEKVLGHDLALPANVGVIAHNVSLEDSHKTPHLRPDKLQTSEHLSATPIKAGGNIDVFGIGAKSAIESDKAGTKRALDFGEEELSRKKLERLPTPPVEDVALDQRNGAHDEENGVDKQHIDAVDEDYDDVDMANANTEEESAAIARAAAEKREERLQAQSSSGAEEMLVDVSEPQPDAQKNALDKPNHQEQIIETDPLDDFMSVLTENGVRQLGRSKQFGKRSRTEPEALYSDEVDNAVASDPNPDDILAIASKKKKKEIPSVNHAKMAYEPFRKQFYSESAELAQMSEADVVELRLELEGIKVRGLDVPKPVTKWSQCGLGVQTLSVVQKLGFEKPTAIQCQAIPAIMSGRDVIGVAKTGSGKTVAFLLPMFRHIKDQKPLDSQDGSIALVMSPTRELATQIFRECKPYLRALGLRAVCAYGGAPIKDQIADLKRGAEIIVCTPGRMIDLLAANSGRVTNLRRVTYLVLDEADRMFDMGFEPQVMKIIANIRPQRQTVLFSATFPRNMEALARKTLTKPIEIIVGGRSVVAPEISQIVELRSEESKFIRLLELLGELYEHDEDARTLVFVDRQEAADGLLRDLLRKGYPCMSIHGGKDQVDRNSAIDDFKAGAVPIMIATSVAARGLDVKQLKLVVNYDAPNHLEDYVHRAGRTGRAGNTGTAVTFLTEEQERYSVDIAKALRQSGQEVPQPVQRLVDAFLEKVKSGKEKASGSGFGGKGLERLDQERDAARNRERKVYRTGDEPEEDDKENETKEEAIVIKPSITTSMPIPGVPKGIDLDGKITVHRTEPSKDPLDRVGSVAADISSRLTASGVPRPGVSIDNKGPDAGAFHATLEINDFPQKARWAVTNRTNVAKILEATGTSITTKGNFYATGKEPQGGEAPKLYILVEGDTEIVVTNAMRELLRLLKEGTIAAADSESRAPTSGRYNVV